MNGGIAVFQIPSAPRQIKVAPAPSPREYNSRIVPAVRQLVTRPGQCLIVDVRVYNDGSSTWPASRDGGRIWLGNHWLDAGGEMIRNDDGRAEIPELKPSQDAMVALPVTAQHEEGDYLLELDLVEKGVTWFAQKGHVTPRIPVSNRRRLSERLLRLLGRKRHEGANTLPAEAPVMEMHCIPQDKVLALLKAAGARVVAVSEGSASGPEYESFHYLVTRPGG
jgi:hypothetical protein